MKKIISITTVLVFILSFGAAFAADNSTYTTDKGNRIFDSMFGARQEVSFDSISLRTAGDVRGGTDNGRTLFDSMFGARQDVAFDSITVLLASGDGTQGRSAGGLRGDADKGSSIFDSMFGVRQIVFFE